jgi:DNA helicase HerA-like ATPase
MHEQDFIVISDSEKTPEKQYLAQISNIIQTKGEKIQGTASILGEIDLEDFSLSPCRFPISPRAQISTPPVGLVSQIISYQGDKGIYLGDVVTVDNNTEPFLISPKFLERHVLCVASTGAGKSYSVGVLLEEILLQFKSAAVLLFDVHNEYWGLARPNDGSEVENLNYKEYSPKGFQESILIFEKDSLKLGNRFDLPRLRRLVDLTSAQENSLLNLIRKPVKLEELILQVQESDIHSSTRENLISKMNSLLNLDLFDEELALNALIRPGQISIVRLDQFIDERKRMLLVNEILFQIFEKKIHGDLARETEIIIIIEEAHRFATTSEILTRIAREGRKFGIYEILVSQRPGDLPDSIIANMNTLIALRIRSDKDLTKIRLMEGISSEIVSILPHLSRGEALIVGLQSGTHRPIKVHIRPRLSNHIDPQEDTMPDDIPRYISSSEVAGIDSEKHFPSLETKKTSYDSIDPKFEDNFFFSSEIEPFNYKDLTNLLACKHILILHKRTGICILEIGVTMLKIDPQLVSGFLSAISGLFSELKDQNIVKERTIFRTFTEEIGDRAFKIITIEGTNSMTAFILDRSPKYLNHFKRRIRNFVYAFETEFHSYLEEFLGVIDDFIPTIKLLDYYTGLSLISPLQIDHLIDVEITNPALFQIIKEKEDQLASKEGLFVEEIVNQSLLDSDYSYREITQTIISYLEDKVLVPIDPDRKLPPLVSQDSFIDIKKQKSEKEVIEESDEEAVTIEPLLLKDKEEEFSEIREEDINWFLELLPKIQINSLPDILKTDILERDLIFESSSRIKSQSVRTVTYSEPDLLRWASIMGQKGFVIQQTSSNPLNGVKIFLKSDFGTIITSITRSRNEDYLLIFGEVDLN